jgi:hypothetical protein
MWNILRRLCHHACFCQRMNLTAVTERSAMMNRHIADSLSLIPMIEEAYTTHNYASTRSGSLKVIDVGSGAGLPGLVLAIACPGKIILRLCFEVLMLWTQTLTSVLHGGNPLTED